MFPGNSFQHGENIDVVFREPMMVMFHRQNMGIDWINTFMFNGDITCFNHQGNGLDILH
jgi:hypothetical protein